MTEEPQAKRGDAAWKEERDAVARRNEEARKRARAGGTSRKGVIQRRELEHAQRESEQLRVLNARLDKQRPRG